MADLATSVVEPKPGVVQQLRRLGQNINGYRGETIDIAAVLADCVEAAREHGWASEALPVEPDQSLLTFKRAASDRASRPDDLKGAAARPARVYISAGIHGDEPAGPLAVRRLLQDDHWPTGMDCWICPCLNPAGFVKNCRGNAQGTDLNRQYLQPQAKEIVAHVAWLERQPRFDLCLCLHEDWEAHGFYLYELNPDRRPSLAHAMLDRVAEVCPIDHSDMIEGRPANKGLISPNPAPFSRPDWPEAFFLLTHKTRLSYTLEAPSDFPLPARVNALQTGVTAALEALAVTGSGEPIAM